jgi:hypothetical protein
VKKSIFFALGLCLALGICLIVSCVSTKAVRLGTATAVRPPIPWKTVAVFRSADQVPGKYEEVGLLMSTGDTMWTNEGTMWNSMKKKAAKLGANGVILDATSEPKPGTKVLAAALFGMGAERKGKAIAIYIFPPEK